MAFALSCSRRQLFNRIGQVKFRFSTSSNPDKVTILFTENKFLGIVLHFLQKGLVLGAYTNKDNSEIELTPIADKYNQKLQGKLLEKLNL